MSPYIAQFLLWHQLNLHNENSNSNFIFFNDGDTKLDHLKQVGNTGGIYEISTTKYHFLEDKIREAMRGGSGGDGPENNVEACMEGLKLYPQCSEIIMIADNWAVPRDISLISKIKIPIHIVLCGAGMGANVEYLNLARATGGSVHTIEEDIQKLATMNEGETITINKVTYKIINGKFVQN